MKAGFISLGCNKNLVDTEKTIALFKEHGYEIVNNPEEAEVIIINTCGFIESAKEEAINTILEMAEYKKQNCKYLIAMGCLVERYKKELEKSIPEVDLYIKYSEYSTLWEQIEKLLSNGKGNVDFEKFTDRVITTGENYAYIKIADGCSNCCTFCAIPKIRGMQKSRTMESLVEEANKLAEQGYEEIILTAQDTTRYGQDIYGEPKLAELMQEICKIDKIKWIRILYSYPETITDKLIQVIKENNKLVYASDLVNSYAWDTAIIFIQTYSGKTDYASHNESKTTKAFTATGKNNDKYCNIWDMSGNAYEWTTEYSTYAITSDFRPCVYRGGYYNADLGLAINYTSYRYYHRTTYSLSDLGLRPLLYVK